LRATSGSFPGPGNLNCPSNFRPESHGQYRVVATTPSRLSYSHRRARRRPAASTTCVRTSWFTSGSIFLFLSENRVLPFSLFLCLSLCGNFLQRRLTFQGLGIFFLSSHSLFKPQLLSSGSEAYSLLSPLSPQGREQ
jgi:hypothetical protein